MLDLCRLHDWTLLLAHCDHRWQAQSQQNVQHVQGEALGGGRAWQ